MGQKSLLILLVIYAVYADAAGSGAETTLVLEAPEAVPVGSNATYQCTSVEGNEVQWVVQPPDGNYYDEADQSRIDELEANWNIYFVPHPSKRALDRLHNITLVAVATEENNNTNITCNEIDPFVLTVVNCETTRLITIGTVVPSQGDSSTVVPSRENSTLCPDPGDLENGMVTFTGNSIGDTATYTCNSGFELVGNATVTCTQVDENSVAYPSVLSVCRPMCSDLIDIVNGMVTFTGSSVGDTATYTCNSGFELVGSATVTCTQVDMSSATFSPATPVCRPMLVLEAPEAVPVGRNDTYQCSTSVEGNEVKWAILTPDGTFYDESQLNLIEELETMWNILLVPHPSDRAPDHLHNVTLVAMATEENNNTNITCQEFAEDPVNPFAMLLRSRTEKLITIGPPLAPAPFVEARNATAVQVSWKEPFIWEGYTIDGYSITVENTSSGEVWRETVNATSIIIDREGIAQTCAVISVSAQSILGSSKPGVVTNGFPIGLFNDAAVSIQVTFKQNDLTPKVDVEFELPSACTFEMAKYTIFIRENGLENETLTYGPNEYSYSNGRSVTRKIPFNSSEPDLAVDSEYLMIIEVNTSAGISISGTINFCTVTRGCEGSTAPLSVGVIVGIAVGSSIIAIFMLCLLILVASFGVQRKRKRRVVVSVRGMVDNPIYVGDEEQYENIEGYQPTFISGPPQIQFMAPAPYAVTGPPPTLPEPRKGKEFENLAENSTPSADRLSKVSVGDDQNVYVKSEC